MKARILFLLMLPAVAAAHDGCDTCHGPGEPAATGLRQPLSGLCIECHRARVDAGEHVVDVPVDRAVDLPLQAGRMTCVTCHDPHAAGRALRRPDPALCRPCHRR